MGRRRGRRVAHESGDVRLYNVPKSVKMKLDATGDKYDVGYAEVALGVLIAAIPDYDKLFGQYWVQRATALMEEALTEKTD